MNIQQDNSKQNARTRHIDIRLTQKEYEAIVEKAAECGLTLSNYGRRLLQNHHFRQGSTRIELFIGCTSRPYPHSECTQK